jgi:hypothetical protein
MHHRHWCRILATAMLLAAIVSGCAWQSRRKASPLVGSWVNRIGTVWTIREDGTFDVDFARIGKGQIVGKYTIEGGTVTLSGVGETLSKDCNGDGVYAFTRSGPELTFTLVRDSCKFRKTNVLLGWRLKR